MGVDTTGTVFSQRRLQSVYYRLEIDCPPIAEQVKPGQFVMLRVTDRYHPLLRRPFSIHRNYPMNHPEFRRRGHVVILYKKVGLGTAHMTELTKGDRLQLIGPLGHGFTPPPLPFSGKVVLIGGGVGIATLYPLAEILHGHPLDILVGGNTSEDILCRRDFRSSSSNLFIATQDGSLGLRGTVVDLLRSLESRFRETSDCYLYACGPMAMLGALWQEISSRPWVSQASLEARMACGFGACWGCVVKTRDPETPYHRVCKDGPVFPMKEILWGEEIR